MGNGVHFRDTLLPLSEDETNGARAPGDTWFATAFPEIEEPPERSGPRTLEAAAPVAPPENSSDLSPDEGLRRAVAARSAATAEILRWVTRCAREGTFRERGFRSMTDFLSTEFAIGLATAREVGVPLPEAHGAPRDVRRPRAGPPHLGAGSARGPRRHAG